MELIAYIISYVMLDDATQGIGTKQVSNMVKNAKNEKWIMVCMSDMCE